ncbi:hypothetical protein MIR68_011028 [Amoeboaphelidium protococcarum]|nr:hypothetical protein MIR68_011028 [Amoeboaphelidium protococcarum]
MMINTGKKQSQDNVKNSKLQLGAATQQQQLPKQFNSNAAVDVSILKSYTMRDDIKTEGIGGVKDRKGKSTDSLNQQDQQQSAEARGDEDKQLQQQSVIQKFISRVSNPFKPKFSALLSKSEGALSLFTAVDETSDAPISQTEVIKAPIVVPFNIKQDVAVNNEQFIVADISKDTQDANEQGEMDDMVGEISQVQLLPGYLKHILPLTGENLCLKLQDNLSDACKLLILDFRPFAAFNNCRIVDSVNIHLPSLLMKRFRRGSVQHLSVETLICSDDGKRRWRELQSAADEFHLVILDDELPLNQNGWLQLSNSAISVVMALVDKELNQVTKCRPFYLAGGFSEFLEYSQKSSLVLGDSTLSNERWIVYGSGEDSVKLALPESKVYGGDSNQVVPQSPLKSASIQSKKFGRNSMRLSIATPTLPISGLNLGGISNLSSPSTDSPRIQAQVSRSLNSTNESLQSPLKSAMSQNRKSARLSLLGHLSLYKQHNSHLAPRRSLAVVQDDSERVESVCGGSLADMSEEYEDMMMMDESNALNSSQKASPIDRETHLDCSKILDWLYLGADPTVYKNSNSGSRPCSPVATNRQSGCNSNEVWISVPSPSMSRPTSLAPRSAAIVTEMYQSSDSESQPSLKSPVSNPIASKRVSTVTTQDEDRVFSFNLPLADTYKTPESEVDQSVLMRDVLPPQNQTRHGHIVDIEATTLKLRNYGIQAIMNMALECPDLGPHLSKAENNGADGKTAIQYEKLGMWDNTEEDAEQNVYQAAQVIESIHRADNQKLIYVHCKAGKSRSATVVIFLLMKLNGWSVSEAYDYVKMRRPCVSPNLGFMSVLNKLELRLKEDNSKLEQDV